MRYNTLRAVHGEWSMVNRISKIPHISYFAALIRTTARWQIRTLAINIQQPFGQLNMNQFFLFIYFQQKVFMHGDQGFLAI